MAAARQMTRNITFKPLDGTTLEWARCLHNDPVVLGMLTDPHVVTTEEQVLWFRKLESSLTSRRLIVVYSGEDVGVVRLDQIDKHNKSVCVGLDIHELFRGKGLAKPVYRALLKEWFTTQKFNRVWLCVAEYNEVALGLYKSLGFNVEGVQRQALYKEGRYHDYIMMSMLKKEYKNK